MNIIIIIIIIIIITIIAKRTITKNRMQMMISPTRLTQHHRVLRELEGI